MDKKGEKTPKAEPKRNIALKIKNYIMKEEPIGTGSYGTVFLAKNEKNEYFAAKRIDREYLSDAYYNEKLKLELTLYHKLKNKHIISLKDIKFTRNHIFIFLEYCDCETLSSFLINYAKIFKHLPSTNIIQNFTRQIADGLAYMANNDCVHRDLKLDNIMISQNVENNKEYHGNISNLIKYSTEASCSIPIGETISPKNCFQGASSCPEYYEKQYISDEKSFEKILKEKFLIKIIDLGLGKKMEGNGVTNTVCGTPVQMAPEIFSVNFGEASGYSNKIDLWSFGCCLFNFAFGQFPFYAEEEELIYKLIKKGDYVIPKTPNLTNEFLDLINGLLQVDARNRYDWDTVQSHPFLTKNESELTYYNWGNKTKLLMNANNKSRFIKNFDVKRTVNINKREEKPEEKYADKFKMFDIFDPKNCSIVEFVYIFEEVDDDWTLINIKTNTKRKAPPN